MSVYSASAASSASGNQRPGRPRGRPDDGDGDGEDYLDQRQSLEAGVFGVLFTLSKEKSANNWKFSLLKAALDYWQLFVTVIDPRQGWNIDADSLGWKVAGVWNFTFLSDQSYTVYVGVLYTVVGLLVVNLALCVWVAVSFKKRQFDYVWPIRVLRIFTSAFFQVFDIASLNLLQLGISCQYVGVDEEELGHMMLFPDVACKSLPHLAHAVISAITLVVFVLVALLLNMAEVELNPLTKRPSSTGHSGPEVWGFAIKACMTLSTAFLFPGWQKVETIVLTVLAGLLTWLYFRWSPHIVGWMNHVKVGTYTSVAFSSALAILLLFHPGIKSSDVDKLVSFQDSLTKAMLALIAPVILLGALASYLRLRLFTNKAVTKYKGVSPETNPKDVYEFLDPRDVEVASRCTRKWVKRDQVDHEAAVLAETIIKAGLFLFPSEAYMTLVYANYLIDVKDNNAAGYRQLEAATKLKPSMMCRFMIFVREQEQHQRSASGSGGAAGQIDLVSYVEFQKSQRMVMRHHKEALLAINAFWQCLLRNHVSFKSLAQALNKIERSVVNAESAYKTALDRYTESYKLMKLYGRFLQMVKNDPWRAAEYFEEAQRLETKQRDEGAEGGQGGMPRVDDHKTAVLIITSKGAIQLYNKGIINMFGYRKGDLEGKSVNLLMPMPFSAKHTSCLQRYATETLTTGTTIDSSVVGKTRPVLGLHADRYGFVIKLSVTKASGTGEDANYMGLMEAVQGDPNICLAFVMSGGIISCVDQHFGMWYGYSPGELLGANFANVMKVVPSSPDEEVIRADLMLEKLLEECDAKPPPPPSPPDVLPPLEPSPLAKDLCIVHKYGGDMPVQVCVWPAGTVAMPLYMVMLRRLRPEPSLMVVSDPKGALKHMSSDLAMLLGYSSGIPNLESLKLMDIMPPTWATMHFPKWLKEPDVAVPTYSCRAAGALTHQLLDLKGKPVPVRMNVHTTDESGELLHIVRMSKTTPQQAVDDRRLQVTIDHRGVITAVVGTSPISLFGLEPKSLVGKPLHSIVPLLAEPEANGGMDIGPGAQLPEDEFHEMGLDAYATPVLNALIKRAMDRPGYSWRVGVCRPGEMASIRKQVKDPALAQSMLANVYRPAVMQMEVNTNATPVFHTFEDAAGRPGTASSHLSVTVNLWRADLLSVCVEVDKDGAIMKVENEEVCPPGLLFGVPTPKLRGEALLQFLGASNMVDLGADPGKKGGLKSSAAAQAGAKLFPAKHLTNAMHHDQQPLGINCQVVVKGTRRWLLLHTHKPSRGHASALATLLPSSATANAATANAFARESLGEWARPQGQVQDTAPAAAAVALPPPVLRFPDLKPPEVAPMASVRLNAGRGSPGPAYPATAPPMMHAVSFKQETSDGMGTGQLVQDVPANPDSAYGVALGSGSDRGAGFTLPHTVAEVDGTAEAEEARGSQLDKGSADGEAESADEGEEGEEGSQKQGAGGRGARAKVVVGDEAGSEASEGGRKSLNPSKLANISSWVATSGETYLPRGAGKAVPDPKVARGLTAGVAEEARLRMDDEDEGGGEDAALLDNAGGVRPSKGSPDDSVMARSKRQGSSIGAVFGKQNRVAPAPQNHARMSSPGERQARPSSPGGWDRSRSGRQSNYDLDEEQGAGTAARSSGHQHDLDHDDAHSDGGDSAGSGASKMSGTSGMSGMSEEDGHDYRRGKRFRKLSKMLDGVEARRVINRLKIHTLCLVGLLLVVQTVSFAMMAIKINEQMMAMRSLSSSNQVFRYNMEIAMGMRTMDNLLTNHTAPGLYRDGFEFYETKVAGALEQMKYQNDFIYFDMDKMNKLDDTYGLLTQLEVIMRTVYMYTNTQGVDVYGQMTMWELLNRYQLAVANYLHNYQEWFLTHNTTSSMMDYKFIQNNCLPLYPWYRDVIDCLLYRAVANTQSVNKLHIIFLALEGCALCSIVSLYYAILLRQVSNQRYALYSVFISIPIGLVRALANQSVKLLDNSDSEGDDDDDDNNGADVQRQRQQQQQLQDNADAKALRNEVSGNLNKRRSNAGLDDGEGATINVRAKGDNAAGKAKTGFVASLRRMLGMAPKISSKRQLVRDNRETVWLMLPIIVWGLLVVVIYTLGYVKLEGIAGPVAIQNLCNFVECRTLRSAYYAQEYVTLAPSSATKQKSMVTQLYSLTDKLEVVMRVMLRGQDAFSLYNITEFFPMIDEGVSWSSKEVADLLYSSSECLRMNLSKCRPENDSFYAISRQGAMPMLFRFVDSIHQLGNLSYTELKSSPMDNPHFQYIWNIGTEDLADGLLQVVNVHQDTIESLFQQVQTLHIILFVLAWIFAILFLVFELRPMIKRARREGKRVAELLSQLPPELNVEKLVTATLKVQASGKEPRNHASKGDEEKDWGRIVRSGSTKGPT